MHPNAMPGVVIILTLAVLLVLAGLLAVIARRRERGAQAANQNLRDSEARYRLFFEDNPRPGYLWDLQSLQFLAVNKAAVEHYGYSREEFLKMKAPDICPPEDAAALVENAPVRRKHRKKDGTHIDVEVVYQVLALPEPAVFALANDITQRLRSEAETQEASARQRKLEEQLRQAGVVAHDFNNVLSVIICYSKLLLANLPPEDPAYRRVEEIHKAGERAAGLTQQLLAFSRKQVLQPNILSPRVDEPAENMPREPVPQIARGEETILVVEDDPGVRSKVRAVLTPRSPARRILVVDDETAGRK